MTMSRNQTSIAILAKGGMFWSWYIPFFHLVDISLFSPLHFFLFVTKQLYTKLMTITIKTQYRVYTCISRDTVPLIDVSVRLLMIYFTKTLSNYS